MIKRKNARFLFFAEKLKDSQIEGTYNLVQKLVLSEMNNGRLYLDKDIKYKDNIFTEKLKQLKNDKHKEEFIRILKEDFEIIIEKGEN